MCSFCCGGTLMKVMASLTYDIGPKKSKFLCVINKLFSKVEMFWFENLALGSVIKKLTMKENYKVEQIL